MKKVIFYALFIAVVGAFHADSGTRYRYLVPDDWLFEKEDGAVLSVWSPDRSAQVIITEFAMKNPDPLDFILKKITALPARRVIDPPSYTLKWQKLSNSDRVAMVHLGMELNLVRYSYRIFAFTRGNFLVMIESKVSSDSEDVFMQAASVAESFKFN
ncbi:MAG: hypothetical protein MUD12_06830 [Spirochaetes bacterium]|jgi:hypothetical protein|nr:hypothetical protein [Spirochaetota bacterium]